MQLTEKDVKARKQLAERTAEFAAMTPGQKAARSMMLSLPEPLRQTIILWRKQKKLPPIPGVR